MNGTLIKIESTHENLRDNEITGNIPFIPGVGNCFILFAKSRTEPDNPFAYRQITTSRIKEVDKISENVIEFKTRSSHYRLEIE